MGPLTYFGNESPGLLGETRNSIACMVDCSHNNDVTFGRLLSWKVIVVANQKGIDDKSQLICSRFTSCLQIVDLGSINHQFNAE